MAPQLLFDPLVVELLHLTTCLADLERGKMPVNVTGTCMRANDKRIQALEAVNMTNVNEPLQGSIYLERRFEAFLAEILQNTICAERLLRLLQDRKNKTLVSSELAFYVIDYLQQR